MDKKEKIAEYVEKIMEILGIEKTPSNIKTPYRIAKMYCDEIFSSLNDKGIDDLVEDCTTFPVENSGYPVVVKDIPFSSMCEHHWLPFFGHVTVTYIPSLEIIGLSKIPRIVKYFSKRPQVQERLTNEIGQFIIDVISPEYVRVEVSAVHTCVQCRGVESPCETYTVFERDFRGEYKC